MQERAGGTGAKEKISFNSYGVETLVDEFCC
jgi:hypothetical protein